MALGDTEEESFSNWQPKEYLSWEEFEYLLESMINNPRPLFEFFRDGHIVNIYEVFIALCLFVRDAEYDDRIQLVFNLFDASGDNQLDRKEMSKLIQSTIYGMIKICQLPIPPKPKVTEFIAYMFNVIDEDSSGIVDFNELKCFVDHNMEIQNFMLRYSRVQTFIRA